MLKFVSAAVVLLLAACGSTSEQRAGVADAVLAVLEVGVETLNSAGFDPAQLDESQLRIADFACKAMEAGGPTIVSLLNQRLEAEEAVDPTAFVNRLKRACDVTRQALAAAGESS